MMTVGNRPEKWEDGEGRNTRESGRRITGVAADPRQGICAAGQGRSTCSS